MTRVYLARYGENSALNATKTQILTRYARDCGQQYSLAYMPNGEPVLQSDVAPQRYVSISHTDGLIAMAFSNERVGIDIERADRKISPKVCSSIEKWTQIESYAKWTGKGLTKDILLQDLPEEQIQTKIIGEYVISICGDSAVEYFRLT